MQKNSKQIERIVLAIIAALLLALSFLPIRETVLNFPEENSFLFKNGKVAGGDFIVFYTSGKVYSSAKESLYDLEFQRRTRQDLVGDFDLSKSGEMPFVYPPLIAVLFSFFSSLPFLKAYLGWIACSSVLSLTAILCLSKELGLLSVKHAALLVLGTLGFIPFTLNCIIGGQLSSLGIIIFCLLYILLRRERPFLAGMALSLSYYKPPLFLFAGAYLVLTQGRYFIAGLLSGIGALSALSIYFVGIEGCLEYVRTVSKYTYGQEVMPGIKLPPGQGAGVYGAMTQITSSPMLGALVLVLIAVSVLIYILKRPQPIASSYSFAILFALICGASVGLSVQCIRYDLSILLVSFYLLFSVFNKLSNSFKVSIGTVIISFYLEFIWRGEEVAGGVYNVSSFLFLALIPILSSAYSKSITTSSYKVE